MWNDRQSSEWELQAALAFWRQWHTFGSRRRVSGFVRTDRVSLLGRTNCRCAVPSSTIHRW
jgi:hypothetical protein